MKIYIWSENLATGAYHADGSCGVVAENKEDAIALLAQEEKEHDSYGYALPASTNEPSCILEAGTEEKPRVLFRGAGCDC